MFEAMVKSVVRVGSGGAAMGSTILLVAGCSAATGEDLGEARAELRVCPVITACDAPPPTPGPRRAFKSFASNLIVKGGARHRGRDLVLRPRDEQWIIGKFAYGLVDKDLKGEEVDIYLLRNCGDVWEKLGTALTTQEDSHPAVEGVDDSGGRVYFRIPESKRLGVGRHRVRLVVAGDQTATELFVEVLEEDTPLFVSDVDGTLTTSELAEVGGVLTGSTPEANDGAAEAFQALVRKGYRPVYLTARAEWGVERTREFLARRGFPAGTVQTSLSHLGLNGEPAASFKTDALRRIAAKGFAFELAFGNTDTDAQAYRNAGVPEDGRYFFKADGGGVPGQRIESYRALGNFSSLPATCQ